MVLNKILKAGPQEYGSYDIATRINRVNLDIDVTLSFCYKSIVEPIFVEIKFTLETNKNLELMNINIRNKLIIVKIVDNSFEIQSITSKSDDFFEVVAQEGENEIDNPYRDEIKEMLEIVDINEEMIQFLNDYCKMIK